MRSSYVALTRLILLVAFDLGAFASVSASSSREREVSKDPSVLGRRVASSSGSDPDSHSYPKGGDVDVLAETSTMTTFSSDGYKDFDFFDVYRYGDYDEEDEDFGEYDDEKELEDLFESFPNGLEDYDEGFATMTAKERQRLRYLQNTNFSDITPFKPLTCNENIDQANCTTIRLSQKVLESTGASGVSEIVIPCGECWYWDYDENSAITTLNNGMDIIGKLHVPSTARGTIRTTYMVVQGELKIDPPDPGNEVKLQMFGTSDVFFHPHDENALACDATNGCKIEKKAIAVAGGTLDIRGIDQPEGCPSWVNLLNITDPETRTTIDVGTDAASCWKADDDILLTSPLMDYEKRFVTTIQSTNPTAGLLTLADPLPEYYREATCAADPDFCVEVASLSRRVVFDAEDDDSTNNGKIGGHLIILLTPGVAQTIEGVEFRNFGQQGLLGRYPIHFHMCGDVTGSLVSKNVVRDSNQRCIVIHGSDNVHILDNVAFECHGHCYFTEDGAETGNIFEHNLGASIRKPDFVIDGENDHKPAVFWIPNPENHWIGNCAAGTDMTGIWFDTRTKVRGPSKDYNKGYIPRNAPLGTFRNNVAHSNQEHGVRTYSPGYQPLVEAVLENTKSYKNAKNGLFLHSNSNIAYVGGILADNEIGIRNFVASNVRFENMTIIGYSEAYERVRSLLGDVEDPHLCVGSNLNVMVGMEIHPWHNIPGMTSWRGATVKDVLFRRLSSAETECSNDQTTAIVVTTSKVQLFHDCPNSFEGIKFEGGMKKIDACDAYSVPIENLSIEDVDGSVGPTGNPGFFVSDRQHMKTFQTCTPVANSCLAFCEGTCLRQVTFKVSNAFSTASVEMVITKGSVSAEVPWMQWDSLFKTENNRLVTENDGRFGATVPEGDYDISFHNVSSGEPAWPDYAFVEYQEPPTCDASLEPSINLIRPPATAARCPQELVRGGDFEDGLFGAWQHDAANLEITSAWGPNDALRVTKRFKENEGASQSVDVSCLVEGFTYDLTADIRMEDKDNDGVEIFCESEDDCPIAKLTFYYWNVALKTATTTSITIATVTDPNQFPNPNPNNEWYKLTGSHTLTALEAAADRVELTFENPKSNNHIIDNVSLRTDDVHTTPTPPPPAPAPPTYNEFGAVADVSIRSNKPQNTYANKHLLQVMKESYTRYVLLKFDLRDEVPSVPASAIDAKLKLYVVRCDSDEVRTVDVLRAREESSWEESTVTWASYHAIAPAVQPTGVHELVISFSEDVGRVVEFDVSDIVAAKVAEGGGKLALQLTTVSVQSNTNNKCEFRSKEGEASDNYPGEPGPKLVVSTGGGVAGNRRFLR